MLNKPESPLSFLQNWYFSQCNEDWEHEFGIKIETLDNPGWQVKIDLTDSDFDGRIFADDEIESVDDRWLWWQADGKTFTAACDPLSLQDALARFRDLIDSVPPVPDDE